MQITKFLHSCILTKENGLTILFDPGQFTYEAQVLNIDTLEQLDCLLITHDHADHFFLPFVEAIVKKFPNVSIISTQAVVKRLREKGIPASTEGTPTITLEHAQHEPILLADVPENLLFTIGDIFAHPGDSYQFTSQTAVLAMPMTAPWGSMVESLQKIVERKPKVVIPIHDWHWKEEAITGYYPRVAEYLKQFEITFIEPETGTPFEI